MPDAEKMPTHIRTSFSEMSLAASSAAVASFARGNGSSGTGRSRNPHSGSQPSLRSMTNSRSGGTSFITRAFQFKSKPVNVMDPRKVLGSEKEKNKEPVL